MRSRSIHSQVSDEAGLASMFLRIEKSASTPRSARSTRASPVEAVEPVAKTMIETAKEVGIFVTLMGPPLRRSQDDIGQRVAGRIAEQKLRGGALELGTSSSGHYYNRSPRARSDRVSLYRRALLAHYPRCAYGLKAEARAPGQRRCPGGATEPRPGRSACRHPTAVPCRGPDRTEARDSAVRLVASDSAPRASVELTRVAAVRVSAPRAPSWASSRARLACR